MDCIPGDNNICVVCGWKWKGKGPFPHRNCPKVPSRGLGDTIAKITTAVGIKPCGGCNRRKEWLNRVFPYEQNISSGDNP
jgi:hypothetical protein